MRKTIVFDFGGVLVDWNPRYFYRSVFSSEKEMEWFLANVCNTPWNLRHDRGIRFEDNWQELAQKYPQYETQIKQYYTGWPQMLNGEIAGSHAVVDELKARGYTLYGLTNWSAQTFPIALKRFEVLRKMDGIVMSGEEKCIKPEPEIYHILLDRYHLQAADCVFIDDNSTNTAAAAALGFDTIVFKDAGQLRSELQVRHIL